MSRRSFLTRLSLYLAALQPALAQQSELEARANLAFSLTRSEVSRVDVPGLPGEPLLAVIDIHGQPVTLMLAPHAVRAAGFRLLEQRADGSLVEVDPGPETTYRGEILELPGSRVFASLLDGGLFARFFLSNDEEYWLEPLSPRVAGASLEQHVLYRREDVICPGETCGADLLPNNQPTLVRGSNAGPPPGGSLLGVQVAELACDAAYEVFQNWGSSTAVSNHIQSVIGAMNLQFEAEVGIRHEITTILVRTSSFQPYTSTDAHTLFGQFRDEWNRNQAGIPRDVAQLFTGTLLNSIAGVGAIGTVCVPSEAYSLVRGHLVMSGFQCNTDLSAHELGHNWNAAHCDCPDSTMNPGLTCTNTFSPIFSRPQIIAYRDSVSCLGSGGGAGPTLLLLSEGFESGTLGTGGWSAQNGDASVVNAAARSGSKGARLKRTTWIERAVNTSGYAVIRLEYSRRAAAFESSERLYVEWWDGSAWQLVESTGSTSWADQSFLLGAAAGNNPAFRIRFRTNANLNNEYGDVDNVRVIGS